MSETPDRPPAWHVTSRLEELRGEHRANALRVLGVAVFYLIEVLNYRGLAVGPIQLPRVEGVDESFHAMATALTVAWIAVAAAVALALRNQVFPPALKYASTAFDVFLISAVLTLADGPKSPVLILYFLVIPLAGLRLSPRLVIATTAGCVLGYLAVVGDVALRRPTLEVPPHWVLTTATGLVLCGVVVTQLVQAARRAAEAFSALRQAEEEPS